MNLVRVLFKKQLQRASSPDDGAPVVDSNTSRRCPTAGVEAASDDAGGETSPTRRSPRRKAHSTAASVDGEGATVKSSEVLSTAPHPNVIFKAIKMSTHKRFAQVLPNLLLGTLFNSTQLNLIQVYFKTVG